MIKNVEHFLIELFLLVNVDFLSLYIFWILACLSDEEMVKILHSLFHSDGSGGVWHSKHASFRADYSADTYYTLANNGFLSSHLGQIEASRIKVENTLTYGYDDKSLGV